MSQKENSESTQFNDNKEQFLKVIHELKMRNFRAIEDSKRLSRKKVWRGFFTAQLE